MIVLGKVLVQVFLNTGYPSSFLFDLNFAHCPALTDTETSFRGT